MHDLHSKLISTFYLYTHILPILEATIVVIIVFSTTCAISAYHHQSYQFESRSWRGVQHYHQQVGGFLQGLQFPPRKRKTDNHDITEILLKLALNIGIKHHKTCQPISDNDKGYILSIYFLREEFGNTKGVIRICISKKNRQHNVQKKKRRT